MVLIYLIIINYQKILFENSKIKSIGIYISIYQKLSENFIREFQDKVDWNYISNYQKLSENFIREFQDKVDWNYIPKLSNLNY